ncbi:MAG: response regulator [Oscillospiraceae bacterium]|nr:response regulator [Oscillospiraceae bacterium]
MTGKRNKIIIVDDIMFQLLSTKERLKGNYEVYPAQSTEILFELLENISPELIILDVNMPNTDGYETLRLLKDDLRYSYIPVIFLSSHNTRANLLKAIAMGAEDFIPKPYTDAELIDSIEIQLNPVKRKTSKPIILAIDDNPSILKSINTILHHDYAVYTLSEPEKIRELLMIISPDLFLLDCNMPILSGFDLIPIIRSMQIHEDTPIVFLTAESTFDNMSAAISLGASDFLVKPLDEILLREKINKYTKSYIIRRRLADLAKA